MNYKLRIKHPSGAEFEAEGPADFILTEKEGFLSRLPAAKEPAAIQPDQEKAPEQPNWEAIAETINGLTILRNKHPQLKAGEAVLLLLASKRQLNGAQEVGALSLSKAIKASGYVPGRIDRLLAKALREGLVKASGTKRNRSYHITGKGLEIAWLEAKKLK
jgi:hypothetical protein